MLCKSTSYPPPPPDFFCYRVSVSAVPGRRTALPRPSRTHRRSSTYSMTPLIRGSNSRLPEPLAGRCPPDTRALAQPSAPRAAGPVADGPLPLPSRDAQIYGLTGRLPLLTPFSRPSSRGPAALHACCDFAPAMPAPTGPPRFGPEYATGRRRLRRSARFPADTLAALPQHPSQSAGPGGSPRRWAGSSRKVRLETSFSWDRDDLPVT